MTRHSNGDDTKKIFQCWASPEIRSRFHKFLTLLLIFFCWYLRLLLPVRWKFNIKFIRVTSADWNVRIFFFFLNFRSFHSEFEYFKSRQFTLDFDEYRQWNWIDMVMRVSSHESTRKCLCGFSLFSYRIHHAVQRDFPSDWSHTVKLKSYEQSSYPSKRFPKFQVTLSLWSKHLWNQLISHTKRLPMPFVV